MWVRVATSPREEERRGDTRAPSPLPTSSSLTLISFTLSSSQGLERRFAAWVDNLDYVHAYNARTSSHWVSQTIREIERETERAAGRRGGLRQGTQLSTFVLILFKTSLTSQLGLTSLADLTHDEYRAHYLGYRADLKPARGLGLATPGTWRYADADPPLAVDWRRQGAVTPVKNQLQCGSCWAFSTTGSVEGINAIKTGELVALSEQELIDCDTSRDNGCHGGLMDFAFKFIIANGGLDTEADYMYKAEDRKCKVDKEAKHVVSIDGYEDVPTNDEEALKKAVAGQPVSVAIEADQRAFQLYAGGVFDGTCGTALDHGVLAVGYGSQAGQDFWVIKNSWGGAWGDRGFIKLARNLDATRAAAANVSATAGQCGIALQASYPVKDGPNPPPGPPEPPGPSPPPPGPTPPGPKPPGPKPPPPGPPPQPQCDEATTCPTGSTCCCMRDFFGYCFTWACCPLPDATCCEDKEHCCPRDLPVCDVEAGKCSAGPGSALYESGASVPWVAKVPAQKKNAAAATSGRPWTAVSAKADVANA